MATEEEKGRGWIEDTPDNRDLEYHHDFHQIIALAGHGIAPEINIQHRCPPIYNQGTLGSCTANAIAAALRYARCQYLNEDNHDYSKFQPSRLYVYWNERRLLQANNAAVAYDTGGRIRDGIKSLHEYGVCPEAGSAPNWPYPDTTIKIDSKGKPIPNHEIADKKTHLLPKEASARNPPAAIKDAGAAHWQKFLGTKFVYHRVAYGGRTEEEQEAMLQQLRRCLSLGYPFIFGFREYDKADLNHKGDHGISEDGVFTHPPPKGTPSTGGHAVMAVGYEHDKRRFLIRNSWGPDWRKEEVKKWESKNKTKAAPAGHFYMPYSWFRRSDCTNDFWVIRIVHLEK
ncbi:MAG: hypothetical protein Q9167_005851 [Letrouitia subvulpina]